MDSQLKLKYNTKAHHFMVYTVFAPMKFYGLKNSSALKNTKPFQYNNIYFGITEMFESWMIINWSTEQLVHATGKCLERIKDTFTQAEGDKAGMKDNFTTIVTLSL